MAGFLSRNVWGDSASEQVQRPRRAGGVLLLSANASTAHVAKAALGSEDQFSVETTIEQAIHAAEEAPPQLIIIDLQGASPQACAAFRKLEPFAQTPIICISATGNTKEREEALSHGASDFVNWPLDLLEIQTRLNHVLDMQGRLAGDSQLSDARWRFALSGSEFGIWDWETSQEKIFFSPALCNIMGLAAHQNVATRSQWADWTHPEDRERVIAAHRALRTGEISAHDIEYRVRGPNEATVWIRERGRILEWQNNQPRRIMGVIADTTERRSSERRLVKLANYDLLTDLPNRSKCLQFLSEALERARITGRSTCFYRIDLSGLAQANHTYGRDAGDEVLKQAAERLKSFTRTPEHVCRFGGKEFALIGERLDAGNAAEEAATLARQMTLEIERPYLVAGEPITCVCRVGACVIDETAHSPEEVIRRSEIALDETSRTKQSALVFRGEMLSQLEARTRLVQDLERAVFTDQFRLAYQPIVDSTGRAVGAEALARWNHPERGAISPLEFIPLAEESGLIVPLGARLRRAACEQLVRWAGRRETAHLLLSVNVSPLEFRAEGFVRDLLLLVRGLGVDPSKLQVELTESLLLGDYDSVSHSMNELKDAGITLALDDFGTGYSSLTHLKKLPFERVKLDRSFVRDILTDPVDASLSRAILAMAQNLGLEPVAEGVEEESQVRLLLEMGCRRFQGYLFGKPAPATALEALCRRKNESATSVIHAIRQHSTPPGEGPEVDAQASILIVDDDSTTLQLLRRILSGYENVRTTQDPLMAKLLADESPPDLLLLDTQMPEMDGFELLSALRENPALADLSTIFVTALLDPETEIRALSMGASDFVSKPLSAARIKLAVRNQLRIKRQTDFLRQQASLDPLTGIANRRSFDRALLREATRNVEGKGALSLLMIDVDHFKAINDECGHPAGDRCLRKVAEVLQGIVNRPTDMLARYGGEEFAVILPLSSAEDAEQVAKRIIRGISQYDFAAELEDQRKVTVSVGWATLDGTSGIDAFAGARPAADTLGAQLVERADQALFRAKDGGRNRACGPFEPLSFPPSTTA